jgi:peptide/nickel transport system permease protein
VNRIALGLRRVVDILGWVGTLPPFRGIWGLLVRRTLLGLVTLLLVSVIIFAATQALPGDPARAILGRFATPASLEALRDQLHLNRPVVQQYLSWLKGLATGDLGRSLAATGDPVTTVIGKRVENSAVLVGLAALVSVPLSILIGVVAARRRDRLFDHVSSLALLALAATPEFVVGILLVVIFGTSVFHVFPPVSIISPEDPPWLHLTYLALPAITLVIGVTPYTARIMRASMIEVLESDYVEMARLKGLPERRVVWRHAVPNALAPTIQVIALNLAYLAGGIVPVEFVFGYPGAGTALVDAVSNRDMPVVQALALLFAAVGIVFYVLADVVSVLVSPRLRTALR